MRSLGTLRIYIVCDDYYYEAKLTDGVIAHRGIVVVPLIISSSTLDHLRIHGRDGQVDERV